MVLDDPEGPKIAVSLPLRHAPLTPCKSLNVSFPLWIVNRRSLKAMSHDALSISEAVSVKLSASESILNRPTGMLYPVTVCTIDLDPSCLLTLMVRCTPDLARLLLSG